jgi:flagella basal body P-ring formation protein FlgA
MRPSFSHALLFTLLLLTTTVQATQAPSEAHENILGAVSLHLEEAFSEHGDQLQIDVTPLDHRLSLSPCGSSLQTFDPPGGISLGRTTVGVSCPQPKPWTLYVSANVGLELPVVVASRDLGRATPLQAGDLQLRTMDTTHLLRGHFDSMDQLLGSSLKRTLRRGQVLTPSMLVAQKTVRRGEQITIVSAIGNIEVRSRGKALRDGNPGDLIPVQNTASKKKLQARVVSAGTVSID